MKRLLFGCALFATLAGALSARSDEILASLRDAASQRVLTVAHRADWRNAPENSLPAIRRALDMGVEIVEIDVRRTKDGRFVVIHDRTLERTTTGTGRVEDHTLAELRELRLLAATGHPTAERIPTLEEALEIVRGRALVNLDKSADHPAEVFAVVKACGAERFALMSVRQSREEMRAKFPGLLDEMLYMVVVPLREADAWERIDGYLQHEKPAVIQVTFATTNAEQEARLASIPRRGVRLWVNSLWPEQNAGHDDEQALTDPDGTWGWLLARGVSIIQTDRPAELLRYLDARGRRR